MDLESESIVVLLLVNMLALLIIVIYLIFFQKWGTKQYDNLDENLGTFKKPYANEMLYGEGHSNVESLIDKNESSVYTRSNA